MFESIAGDDSVHVLLAVLTGLCTLICAVIGFVVHGFADDQKEHTKRVTALEKAVAVLLDRDRRKRLEDYENERSPSD